MKFDRDKVKLDPVELKIFKLKSEGHSIPQIARYLQVSEATVTRRTGRIFARLRLGSSAQVLTYLRQRGDLEKLKPRLVVPNCQVVRQHRLVTDLLLQGYSNQEIAEELDIHKTTVAVYIHRVGMKYGASNRHELFAIVQCEREVIRLYLADQDTADIAEYFDLTRAEIMLYLQRLFDLYRISTKKELAYLFPDCAP